MIESAAQTEDVNDGLEAEGDIGESEQAPPPYVAPTGRIVTLPSDLRLHCLTYPVPAFPQGTLVFLAGLGENAWCFDNLAQYFLSKYRVISMTRRGYGQSDQATYGYDVDTRARDVLGLLDALDITGKVNFAGHSIAGAELSRLGGAYPERVQSLIYLDSYFDWSYTDWVIEKHFADWHLAVPSAIFDEISDTPPPGPLLTIADVCNYYKAVILPGYARLELNVFHELAADNILHNLDKLLVKDGDDFVWRAPDRTDEAISGAVESYDFAAEWKSITAPVLLVEPAYNAVKQEYPWLLDPSPAFTWATKLLQITELERKHQVDQFKSCATNAKTIETAIIDQANHYVFLDQPGKVASSMAAFLTKYGMVSESADDQGPEQPHPIPPHPKKSTPTARLRRALRA